MDSEDGYPQDHGDRPFRRSYTPSNIDFLSIPQECAIDYGIFEAAFLININRLYGMMAALSEGIRLYDPLTAYEAVNASLLRFWNYHHSDMTIAFWSEECCWRIAKRYWA